MKRIDTAESVILEPSQPADAVIIWLHGLGADGNDFVPLVSSLRLTDDQRWRFIFPHAPVMPVTLNGGMPMRAWYDIISLDRAGLQDSGGVRRSQHRIDGLIDGQVTAGIRSDRIVLAGFSQGGAVVLQTGLRHREKLGGLLALSTYLPLADTVKDEAAFANRGVAILMQHGRHDLVLSHSLGTASRDQLRALGYEVAWDDYPMQHEVCASQIDRIGAWLRQRLPSLPT